MQKKVFSFRLIISFIALFSFLSSIASTGGHPELSDSSSLTLLTCDPGTAMYAKFGHSALAIHDPANNVHLVFNYGTFSFETPGFYRKFLSGKLEYKLSIESYGRFKREYQYYGRKVVEQELNLTPEQRKKVYDYLMENYKPENRFYKYDFLFDNCATRILLVLHSSLGDQLVHDSTSVDRRLTFRKMINHALEDSKWSGWGIAFMLGRVIDRPATAEEQTFLPEYLSYYVSNCTVNGKPLVKDSVIIVPSGGKIPVTPFYYRPAILFWLLLVVILFFSIRTAKKEWVIADRIIFVIYGILGLIIFLFWFATEHSSGGHNWNLLWASPFYLIFAWFIRYQPTPKLLLPFVRFFLLLNSFVLVCWFWLPQDFNKANAPLISILIIRLSFIHWKLIKK